MRLILLIIFIVYKLDGSAQKITTKFDIILSEDDFLGVSGKWDQRSTANDFFIAQDGYYYLKNNGKTLFSTSLHTPNLNLKKYEVIAQLKCEGSKKADNSLGLLLNAKNDGSGAIVCEINGKRQYRVRKFLNGQWEILSFNGVNGWNSDKALKNKGFNEIIIRSDNGLFDLYINATFIFSFTDNKLNSGNLGFIINPGSEGKVDLIKILGEANVDSVKLDKQETKPPIETSLPQSNENEVLLLLKTKIDKQQKKIGELEKNLESCKLQKSGDTSLERKNIDLIKYNESILIEKGRLLVELQKAKEKLVEFELLKQSVVNEKNGDIIITLNEIINREKRKNQDLLIKIDTLETENKQLQNSINDLLKEKK